MHCNPGFGKMHSTLSRAAYRCAETQQQCTAALLRANCMLVGLLHCIWDPVQRWVDPYPDWLDRIAHVQSLSILKAAQEKKQKSEIDTLQKSPASLQASEHWLQAVKFAGVKDLNAKAKYYYKLQIRERSEADITSEISTHMMTSANGGISWKQACITQFFSLSEKL